jgi:hypothetical protein
MLVSLPNSCDSKVQIEIERVLNLANVLTTLKHYYLQVQNLDQIIIVVNNWLNDLCLNYTQMWT